MIIVGSDTLDLIWFKWNMEIESTEVARVWYNSYSHICNRYIGNRDYGSPKHFEDWLWEHGARVERKDKKSYLKFENDEDASFFLLRWT